jgi:serine/threonine-protein kinase RsbW
LTGSSEILVINSERGELKKAEQFLRTFFVNNDLPLAHFNKVFLCLSEAVLNAILHGNQRIFDKRVYIKADCYMGLITIEITDEGDGFDFHKLENPTKKKNIKRESGRGIHIIKSLSQEIKFKNNGSCIQFKIECK